MPKTDELVDGIKTAPALIQQTLSGERQIGDAHEDLRTAIELTGPWLQLADLNALKDIVSEGKTSLNDDLKRAKDRLDELTRKVFRVVNQTDDGGGVVFYLIKACLVAASRWCGSRGEPGTVVRRHRLRPRARRRPFRHLAV